MKKIYLLILGFVFLVIGDAFCQEQTIVGVRYGGVSFQDWQFSKGDIELNGGTEGRFIIGAFAKKEISQGLFLGLDLSFLAANEHVSFRFSGAAGKNKYFVTSLGPTISKQLFFIKEKFGFNLGMGLAINFLNSQSFIFEEDDSFRIIRVDVKDEFGNSHRVPLNDIVFSGERTVDRKVSFFIRPEINLFYNLSERLRFSITHMRGYNPGKPLISRNLDPIVYEGKSYKASDYFVGNYRSTNISLEYRIH